MGNLIYPLAWQPKPDLTGKLYYLGFPLAWKAELLEIARRNNPRFKDEHGLPTNSLKKLTDSWMEGVIALSALKKGSNDERWLTSCSPYSDVQIKALCGILKVWLLGTYDTPKANPAVKTRIQAFCSTLTPEALLPLRREEEVLLTNEDGTVTENAYQALPLLAVNTLLGKELLWNGHSLRLCSCGKNQLITEPITDAKSHHRYSLVLNFSVQTTPPMRHALLLCHMSTRRWIYEPYRSNEVPYFSHAIHAHIPVGDQKYCQIPIEYQKNRRGPDWRNQDRQCYNLYHFQPLPDAQALLMEPNQSDILLPYKNGMPGFMESSIGTGISLLDKEELSQNLRAHLELLISDVRPEAKRVSPRNADYTTYKNPAEYPSREAFRSWVRQCAETDQITFELYGLWQDPVQCDLLTKLEKKLNEDFGANSAASCLEIHIVRKETGALADQLPDNSRRSMIQRSGEILEDLGNTEKVTACLFVLPGKEKYDMGDPKAALRNAFARSGRVVQFITPESGKKQVIMDHAVYDLYRQLGVVTLLNLEKMPRLAGTPCVGFHLCKQVHGISSKGRFLPVYITVHALEGKVRVHCDAFATPIVSYRQACMEMARLFFDTDLERRCTDASRSPVKKKLIELKNRYQRKENSVVLVAPSDGDTRVLWSGLSDKEIGQYPLAEEYCPTQINAGSTWNRIPFSLLNTGVRILRIRSNHEVPDYYTELSKKSTSERRQLQTSGGVFQYRKTYWCIHPRAKDKDYINSAYMSRIINPSNRFAEKDMVEIYPLQLQPGDKASEWVCYVNALRKLPIQYDQNTVLPLPLHLAKALEEYLFDI